MERGRFLAALEEFGVHPLQKVPSKGSARDRRFRRRRRALEEWLEGAAEAFETGADLLADAVSWHERREVERPNAHSIGRFLSARGWSGKFERLRGKEQSVYHGLRLRPLGTPGAKLAVGGGERWGSVLSTKSGVPVVLRRMRASWPEILRQGAFGRGRTLVVWTMGQGGSLGLVDALLRRMGDGPVGLQFSIWAGEGADVRQVEEWVGRSRLESARWIVDRSFEGRDPRLAEILRRRFGADCIVTARMHAKAIVLRGPDWRIAAVTSASLDPATRLEHWVISDDEAFCEVVEEALAAAVTGESMPPARRCGPGWSVRFSNPGEDSVELIEEAVESAPGADLSICVWCCSIAHLERVQALLQDGRARSVRWLVDASMVRGNPRAALRRLRDVFGDESIRGCSVHGKAWRYRDVTCLTSANLNRNPRVESHIVFEDPGVAEATDEILKLVWARQPPGDGFIKGRGLRINRVLARKGSG